MAGSLEGASGAVRGKDWGGGALQTQEGKIHGRALLYTFQTQGPRTRWDKADAKKKHREGAGVFSGGIHGTLLRGKMTDCWKSTVEVPEKEPDGGREQKQERGVQFGRVWSPQFLRSWSPKGFALGAGVSSSSAPCCPGAGRHGSRPVRACRPSRTSGVNA